MRKKKKSLKEEIRKATKQGSGANLRIPASYHRIGKIEPACSLSDKQIMAIAKKRAKLRKWLEKKKEKEWQETLARIA